jgi:ABC-type sugar transport system ATPase subunit
LLELKRQGAFIFVSSHNISQLIKISDTLTVVKNGMAVMKSDSLASIEKEIEENAKSKVKQMFYPPTP